MAEADLRACRKSSPAKPVRRNEAEYGSILLVRYLYQAKVIEFVLFPVTITEGGRYAPVDCIAAHGWFLGRMWLDDKRGTGARDALTIPVRSRGLRSSGS